MPDWRRTETGLTAAIVCLAFAQHVFAQDIDPRCKDIFDKVACSCAVRNGGRRILPPGGINRAGRELRPKAETGGTQKLDGGRVAVPKYYRREGLKIRRSHALEGYLACLHAAGRK